MVVNLHFAGLVSNAGLSCSQKFNLEMRDTKRYNIEWPGELCLSSFRQIPTMFAEFYKNKDKTAFICLLISLNSSVQV
jgi:hypothetical protein